MTGNIQVATTVLGGLSLFIYGMGLMSAVKDVARHLENIAEHIETERI